jgi:proline iminopeptidase
MDKYHKYKSKYLNLKYNLNGIQDGKSYKIVEPFNTNFLDVGNNHKIYYEESGNPKGIPLVHLHGGPGGGSGTIYTQLFDTSKLHIIAFDQRGCGKSTPFGSLENNTTWDLVKDIEKLRFHLKIDKWIVTGGSWGSTLSLLYAIKHPNRVSGLHISGVCLLRQSEIDWLYKKGGASCMNPQYWEDFEKFIPENERDDMVKAYYKRLTSEDQNIQNEACRIWSTWELTMTSFYNENKNKKELDDINKIIPLARIECHYFINKSFFPNDNYILENINKIKDIPLYMVQGEYDIVCPIESAFLIKKALPSSHLNIVTVGGHDRSEKPMIHTFIKSMNNLVDEISKKM